MKSDGHATERNGAWVAAMSLGGDTNRAALEHIDMHKTQVAPHQAAETSWTAPSFLAVAREIARMLCPAFNIGKGSFNQCAVVLHKHSR